MKNLIHFLPAALCALLLGSCGPELVSVPSSSRGRQQLQRHSGLDRLAQQHSEFMLRNRGKFGTGSSSNLSHYGFEDRALRAQHSMNMANVGENIATCSGRHGDASFTLVSAWQRSSGHEKNMRGQWDVTGVGVAVADDGSVFATQLFANENRSHMMLVNRMRR
jgi:uncharacterized protein YkwD